jgi:hypothetical protein
MKAERIETHTLPGDYEVQVLRYKNGNMHYRLTYKPNNMQLGYINKEYMPHFVNAMNAPDARVQLLAKALRDVRTQLFNASLSCAAADAALAELNEQKEG